MPAGTLPWLGFDRAQPNRWFARASIVESMHWMVLRRPVELARVTGNREIHLSRLDDYNDGSSVQAALDKAQLANLPALAP